MNGESEPPKIQPFELSAARVVRLNATLFPISRPEAELCQQYGLREIEMEVSSPEEIALHAASCDALFVVSAALPAEAIRSLKRCRVISRLGAGTDKIDVAEATRQGILVTNVPYFCVEEQADHTFALLLAVARKLPQMDRAMRRGDWLESRHVAGSNRRLAGLTLGLVGFGSSAKAVARRAIGFGMHVVATRRDMSANDPVARELCVRMLDLATLVAESDYVSLHLPLNAETRQMFDRDLLARMKPGSVLINTARGAIVDESALVDALRAGHLSGAGLDVFAQINVHSELSTPPDHPLLSLDNVVLTPHVGAYSIEAKRDVAVGGVENVVAALSGRWPRRENVVNPDVVPRFELAPEDDARARD